MQASLCTVIIFPNLLLCDRNDFLPSVRVQLPTVNGEGGDLPPASARKHKTHPCPGAQCKAERASLTETLMGANEKGSVHIVERWILILKSPGSSQACP